MEKLHRDIKKMVNNVRVPTDQLNETVQAALFTAKKKKKRSFSAKHHVIVSIASIFVLAISGLLIHSYYPEFEALLTQSPETSGSSQQSTETIPYTDSIFYRIGDEGLKRMAIEGRTERLSLESEDQGIKVILEEGYLDSQQMAISFRVDPIDSMMAVEESYLSMDLVINGISKGRHGYSTKDLIDHGGIFQFESLQESPRQSEIDIHITSINNVEGNWSFTFDLQQEKEYITKSYIAEKVDEKGNAFYVNLALLTPSRLILKTRTSITLGESISDISYLHMSIVAPGPDGVVYLPETSRRNNNNDNAYDQIHYSPGTMTEFLEIPRGYNSYFYMIVPYIATYKGESIDNGKAFTWDEITSPFRQGAILETDSKIKVANIKKEKDETVVHYEMDLDPSLPIFPKIVDHKNNEYFYAISYKLQDNYVEVTYPKVENTDSLEFLMYDADYKVFSDLEVELDLN